MRPVQCASVRRDRSYFERDRLPVRFMCAAFATLLTLAVSLTGRVSSEPHIFPTGVTVYDPSRAYNCYVLYDSPDATTRLVDMDGHEVHTWPYGGFPSYMIDPSVNGGAKGHVILHLAENTHGPTAFFGGTFDNHEIGEVDWAGNTLWRWGTTAPGGSAKQTHDVARLRNGDTLIISSLVHAVPGFAASSVLDPAIYEISPRGTIVWQWLASQHLDEFGFSAEGLATIKNGPPSSQSGFFTINTMRPVGPNHWFDSGDQRFNPDNILINSREGSFMAIIEKSSGHVVWRLGPYFEDHGASPSQRIFNAKVPRPVDQLSGEHDAQIIPKGLPGAGNILVLDNQGEAGYPPIVLAQFSGSRILEIDPITGQIVWQYTASDSLRDVWTFSTTFIGDARRLPNGNTLINEGMNGRFFQITPSGDIVWEYVNPHFAEILLGRRSVTNAVYRAVPIPYDWVPAGTPHSEAAIVPPDVSTFRVPGAP